MKDLKDLVKIVDGSPRIKDRALFLEALEFVRKEFAGEGKEGQSEEQFIYSTRKKALGPMKRKFWDLSAEVRSQIVRELEERFGLLFEKLKVVGTRRLVQDRVEPLLIRHPLPSL